MKKLRMLFLFLLVCLSAGFVSSSLATMDHEMKPYVGSAEFERVKQLAGSWEGTHQMGEEEETPAKAEYKVTSNGSAVVETLFPGTPHEMVTVYFDKNGKLSMTHYCSLANQPQMDLVSSKENEIQLSMNHEQHSSFGNVPHMHALTLEFEGKDHLIHHWKFYAEGKESGTTVIKLTRKL